MRKPDILETLTREGIHVKHNKAHCPFHEDDTPSLFVYPDSNSWYCYGCCIGGDAIEFIRKYRGLGYKQAIAYLGVREYVPNKRDIKKRKLIADYEAWERRCHAELCCQYRTIQNHKRLVRDMDDVNATAYHAEAYIIYRLDMLDSGNVDAKLILYKGEKNV